MQKHNPYPSRKSTKTIPIPKSHIPRTQSELQLGEEHAIAEWRDNRMFQRLVNGIWEKRRQNRRVHVQNMLSNPDESNLALQNDLSRDMHSQRIIESIIWSRNKDLSDHGHENGTIHDSPSKASHSTSTREVDLTRSELIDILDAATDISFANARSRENEFGRQTKEEQCPPILAPKPLYANSPSLVDLLYASPAAGHPALRQDEDPQEECIFNLEL